MPSPHEEKEEPSEENPQPSAENPPGSMEEAQVANVTITEAELQQLKHDAADYKDKYLRLLAEVENTRKRLVRERQEISQLSNERVIVDFLHPLDNLENALKFADQASGEVKNWAMGFQMIVEQFKEVLAQHGVKSVPVEGTQFDPHHHEAIEIVETNDFPAGTIIQECTRGYQLGSKTIRPARVKVATSISTDERETSENQNNEPTTN